MVQKISPVNSQNKYIIPNQQSNAEKECASQCEDKEWQKLQSQGTGRLQMHSYRN